MQGAYGGLIVIIAYANSHNLGNFFLWLDGTTFTLLSGESLTLL